MHIMIMASVLSISLLAVVFFGYAPSCKEYKGVFLVLVAIVLLSSVAIFMFISFGKEYADVSSPATETCTLIDQDVSDGMPCYAIIDGHMAYFAYHGENDEIQIAKVDVSNIDIYYRQDKRTVTMSHTVRTSYKKWWFLKGFKDEIEEYRYIFRVPAGTVLYTYVHQSRQNQDSSRA